MHPPHAVFTTWARIHFAHCLFSFNTKIRRLQILAHHFLCAVPINGAPKCIPRMRFLRRQHESILPNAYFHSIQRFGGCKIWRINFCLGFPLAGPQIVSPACGFYDVTTIHVCPMLIITQFSEAPTTHVSYRSKSIRFPVLAFLGGPACFWTQRLRKWIETNENSVNYDNINPPAPLKHIKHGKINTSLLIFFKTVIIHFFDFI